MVGAVEALAVPASEDISTASNKKDRICRFTYGAKWCVVKIPPVHFVEGKLETRAPLLPPWIH